MKKLFFTLLALCPIAYCAALVPVVTDESIPASAQQMLTNKIMQIASKNECEALNSEAYEFTATVDILSQETTATTPPMQSAILDVHFFIIDADSGQVLATHTAEVKGAGKTSDKALISAIKTIKTNDPGFKMMLDKAKKKACPPAE